MAIKILSPKNNAVLCPVKELAKEYLDSMHNHYFNDERDYKFSGINCGLEKFTSINDYYKRVDFFVSQVPVIIQFSSDEKGKFTLILSLDNEFKNIVLKRITSKREFKLENLLINKTYYWMISSDLSKTEVHSFILDDYIRSIACGTLFNFRDIGGKMTKYGKRVKQGCVYRGREIVTQTHKDGLGNIHRKSLSKSGQVKFLKILNNGIELDFRGKIESNYLVESPANYGNKRIGYQRFDEIGAYDHYFVLEKQELFDEVKQIFELIADSNEKPVYLHCAAGADRTGSICFLLESILGMKYIDMICDYEYTTFCKDYRNHFDPIPSYEAFVRFKQMYEEIEKYIVKYHLKNDISVVIEHLLINRFNIKKETIDKIRDNLLE